MFIDDKGKLFGKISIIDILVVCLILGGIAGAYYKFGRSNTISPFVKPDRIEMTFFTEDVVEFVGAGIKAGDLVKDRVGPVLGKVKEVVAGPGIYHAANEQGQMIKSSKEGYISLKVVIEGDGVYTNNGVTFSNMDYYVNKWFEIRVGNVSYYTRIKSIRKIEE